jgi:hypothetical protein
VGFGEGVEPARLTSVELLGKKEKKEKKKKGVKILASPERFELSRGNPMYLAGTRLNHSAKATLDANSASYNY